MVKQVRMHIVAPRHWPDWTLYCQAEDRGLVRVIGLDMNAGTVTVPRLRTGKAAAG